MLRKKIITKNNNGFVKITLKDGKSFKWNKKAVFQNSKNENTIDVDNDNKILIKIYLNK